MKLLEWREYNQRVDSTGKAGALFSFAYSIGKLNFPYRPLTFPAGHAKHTLLARRNKQKMKPNSNLEYPNGSI